MNKIQEMKEKRGALVKEARTLVDLAETEKRDMSAEENQQYDKIMADVDKMGDEIRKLERLAAAEDEMRNHIPGRQEQPGGKEPEDRANPRKTEEYRQAFNRFLRSGASALSESEIRSMIASNDATGGYMVAPEQMVNQLIADIDDAVLVRQFASKFKMEKAESLGVPTFESDLDDADWTSEITAAAEGNDIKFGKRELKPYQVSKLAKVSNRLLRIASMDIEALVRSRLAYKFALTHEKAFLTGDGQDKPLGLFVASANGINTDRDVSTGNTATSVTSDGLIEAKFSLKPQYWANSRWLFHRDGVKQIRKLKDGDGQYIWEAGIKTGAPDTILDLPYMMSEYAPNTFTTAKYVGILGDFSFYWVVDALDMQIQRVIELYALTNQTGFIGRMETDGMPVLDKAFVRVKLG